MKTWHMVTVVGTDKVGIVAAITQKLVGMHAELGETRMMRLGGNFSMMMMVLFEGDSDALKQQLGEVADAMSLRIHVDDIEAHLHEHLEPNAQVIVHGADAPGIVAKVTAVLAEHGFNVLDLDSDVSGTDEKPVYMMIIDGDLSDGLDELNQALSALSSEEIQAKAQSIELMLG